jgi:hypothetical protein
LKILVTGKGGKAGGWKIRGEQLGAAIGAAVIPLADVSTCSLVDIVIVVKRTPDDLVRAVRKSGRPWVWDIVDGWPQPSNYPPEQALAWLHERIRALKPTAIVFGTERMQQDAGFDGPSLVLPHHSWQRYVERQPVTREVIETVGYEGDPRYLGKWLGVLQNACDRRGWHLQINGDMTQADIGVALRESGGYPAKFWKPGTKLSNLHALGIPAICSPEEGCRSVASGAEFWVESKHDIDHAFDQLADMHIRQHVARQMRSAMLPVAKVAEKYGSWLKTLC